MKRHLHISLGPVQGFVAQARRTRDLWGGSYILSLLAAHAMRGARAAGGTVVRPIVDDDPLIRWVERRDGAPPRLGSLPNQFTVQLAGGSEPRAVAQAAKQAFQEAWHRACSAVWREYVAALAPYGRDTASIWDRQIHGFWELVWVEGAHDDLGLLAARKRWRTHLLPEEAGDKCTVMPELQELSGYVRTSAAEREKQDAFWCKLRGRLGGIELRERERLCAVALVKRLYARVALEAVGGALDVTRWPSTIDVAAALWVRRALEIAPDEVDAYAGAVLSRAAEGARTGGVSSLVPEPLHVMRAAYLGANWYHRAFVASPRLAPLDPHLAPAESERARAELIDRLDALFRAPDGEGGTLGSPPIYYALLLADGDRLGELVRVRGGEVVSRALAAFTAAAPDIITRHSGRTVYAGGDDVLALLPVRHALGCAQELEQAYRRSFGDGCASLSAAIVFAHGRAPLHRVLAEAHRLLDDVAKDENDRASLAASVYRGDAPAIQWVTTWERTGASGRKAAAVCVQDAVHEMAPDPMGLSSSLLHDLRRMLGLLGGKDSATPGTFTAIPDGIDVAALVKAEIEHRFGHHDDKRLPDGVARLTSIVVDLLHRSRREDRAPTHLGIDGLALASFLANDGREDEHRP
jgi:CRISPR-associated protein Cmr2